VERGTKGNAQNSKGGMIICIALKCAERDEEGGKRRKREGNIALKCAERDEEGGEEEEEGGKHRTKVR